MILLTNNFEKGITYPLYVNMLPILPKWQFIYFSRLPIRTALYSVVILIYCICWIILEAFRITWIIFREMICRLRSRVDTVLCFFFFFLLYCCCCECSPPLSCCLPCSQLEIKRWRRTFQRKQASACNCKALGVHMCGKHVAQQVDHQWLGFRKSLVLNKVY